MVIQCIYQPDPVFFFLMGTGGGWGVGGSYVVMAVHGCGGFTLLFHFYLFLFLYEHFVKCLISRLSPKCFMMVTVQTHNSMCL